MKMNREHRYNTLTPNYVRDVKRGIETLNLDEAAKVIVLSTQNGEHFCQGTDFRTIMHYKKENEN